MRRDPSESWAGVYRILEVFSNRSVTTQPTCSSGVYCLMRTSPNVSIDIHRKSTGCNNSVDHLSALIPSASSVASFDQTRSTVSGVTIMSLKRGFTNEGDRILDYLVRIQTACRQVFDAYNPGKGYIRGDREAVPSPLHLCHILG